MPQVRFLPSRPDLQQLRKQARELLRAWRHSDAEALALLQQYHPAYTDNTGNAAKLADAQLVLARHYGFNSWPRLKAHVEFVNLEFSQRVERFVLAATANHSGGNDRHYQRAREMLAQEPALAQADFYTALVLGDAGFVERELERDPALIHQQGGPRNRQPLLYVTYSKFHRDNDDIGRGLLAIAGRLLQLGADADVSFTVEPWNDSPLRPLYGACGVTNFPQMATLLLDHGATIDDYESLYHSLEQPDTRCLELLLARGADPAGTNALNHSLDRNDIGRTRMLLEHGADPNEVFEPWGTALHFAVTRGRSVETLQLLVDHGADIDAHRGDGRTPYQVALQYGHNEAAKYLQQIGAKTDASALERFFAACSSGDNPTADQLMREQPHLLASMTAEDSRTLLRLAELGNAGAIRTLLQYGFPADVLGSTGETALHIASWHGQHQVVAALLEYGAPLEVIENTFGCTPLSWAAHGCDNWPNPDGDYIATVQALLAAGADVTTTNKWGENLIALAGGNSAVGDLLRAHGARDSED